jgi:hypothetical protein
MIRDIGQTAEGSIHLVKTVDSKFDVVRNIEKILKDAVDGSNKIYRKEGEKEGELVLLKVEKGEEVGEKMRKEVKEEVETIIEQMAEEKKGREGGYVKGFYNRIKTGMKKV